MALEENIKVKVDAVLEGLAQFQALQKELAEIKKIAAQKIRVDADARAFQSDLRDIQSDLKALQKLADKGVKLDADPTALAKQLGEAQERLRSLRDLTDKPLELEIETNTLTAQIKELQAALKAALGEGEEKLALKVAVEADGKELEKSVKEVEGQLKAAEKLAVANKIPLQADAKPFNDAIKEIREQIAKLKDLADDPITLKAETDKINAQVKKVQDGVGQLAEKASTQSPLSGVRELLEKFGDLPGVDKLSDALGTLEEGLGGVAGEAEGAGSALGALAGPVGLAIAVALAAVAAYAKLFQELVELTAAFAEHARAVDNASKATGLSVELISALEGPLKSVEADLTDLTDAYAQLAGIAANAAEGNKEAAATLKQLGITAQQALTKPDEAFAAVIKRLSEIKNGAERAALASKAFGEEGGRQFAALAAREPDLAKLIARARELGLTLSTEDVAAAQKFNREVAELHQRFEGFTNSIARIALPELARALVYANRLVKELTNSSNVFGVVFGAVLHSLTVSLRGLLVTIRTVKFALSGLSLTQAFGAAVGETQAEEAASSGTGEIQTTAGPVFSPKADDTAAKKAADAARKAQEERERAIQRAEEFRRAQADQTLAFLRDTERRQTDNLDAQLQQNLISIGNYYAQRRELQRATLQAELDEAYQQRDANALQPQRTPEQQQKVALDGLRIGERIELLKRALADLGPTTQRELNAALTAFNDSLKSVELATRRSVAETSDNFVELFDVAKEEIAREYAELVKQITTELGAAKQAALDASKNRAPVAEQRAKDRRVFELQGALDYVEALKKRKEALAQVEIQTQKLTLAQGALQADLAALNQQVTSGAISQTEATEKRLERERAYKEVLEAVIAELERLQTVLPGTDLKNKIQSLRTESAPLGTQTVNERFNVEAEKYNRVLDERAAKERDVQIQVRNGQLSELQGREKLKKIYQEYLKQLEEMLQRLADIAVEANPEQFAELTQKLTELRQRIADTNAETQNAADEIKSTLANSLETGFTNFFEDVITGTKSVGDAFKDLARTILAELAKVIIKLIVTKILMAALGGGAGGGLTATAAGTGGTAGSALGSFATGGPIVGPGTDTSDNLLARLSPGEFVVRAKSVRQIGVDALHALNRYGRLPAFADGGLVGPESTSAGSLRRGNLNVINTFHLPNVRDVREFKANEAALKRDLARATAQGAARFQGGR